MVPHRAPRVEASQAVDCLYGARVVAACQRGSSAQASDETAYFDMTAWRSTESFGDSGDWPMSEREAAMARQVCDPPGRHGMTPGEPSDNPETVRKRELDKARKLRQITRKGKPCPHECGFILAADSYGKGLGSHERACPKLRVA